MDKTDIRAIATSITIKNSDNIEMKKQLAELEVMIQLAETEAFKQNITYLAKRGFKPTFNVMDNVASAAVKAYLEEAEIGLQLVEPHNHRANAANCTMAAQTSDKKRVERHTLP